MTDKELKRLKRVDLLELLIAQSRENERLRKELEETRRELETKELKLEQAGSIAEAALQLNGVFEAAQAAADQYLLSVKARAGAVPGEEGAGPGAASAAREEADNPLCQGEGG